MRNFHVVFHLSVIFPYDHYGKGEDYNYDPIPFPNVMTESDAIKRFKANIESLRGLGINLEYSFTQFIPSDSRYGDQFTFNESDVPKFLQFIVEKTAGELREEWDFEIMSEYCDRREELLVAGR